ncbi:hypothetical protein LTR66_000412 [Elasticomyces elasticus]|nr:hypothetical protein LTR50_001206 [Elasticomyces elasticus]KAK5000781.1 hypothetical protein LTR66_000412 [Elasticomyces elasticus]
MTSFANATSVGRVDSHKYSANFPEDWCIGSVPHGGFITSCFLQVASAHFSTTLAKQKQPDTITLHLDFLRRTQVGPATFIVNDVKLGRQTSVIHVTLRQDDREEVVGYLTNSNLAAEEGMSLSTNYRLEPPSYPAAVSKLKNGTDKHWKERKRMPFAEWRKAGNQVRFFFPEAGQLQSSIADQWICFTNGDRFTSESIGFVADIFPQLIEAQQAGGDPYSVKFEERNLDAERVKRKEGSALWYPTLLLNLDVKKALPAEGIEWLFVRTRTKVIKNGRYDLEIIIMDEDGDIVALSHHVCLVVSAERNMAGRRKRSEQGESKL